MKRRFGYVVEHDIAYEGSTLVGVFSSRARADAFVDELGKLPKGQWYNVSKLSVNEPEWEEKERAR